MMLLRSKRFRLLQLTGEGVALVKRLIPSGHVLNRRLLEPLSKEEQRVFLSLLKKFVHLNNEKSRAPLNREFADLQLNQASKVEFRRGGRKRRA